MFVALVTGLFTGWSLIVAIGAQNAFVIRQGLTKKYVLPVVLVCALADISLIAAGVAGLGALLRSIPAAFEIIRWAGVVYLLWFGIKSVRSAIKPGALDASGNQSGSLKTVLLTVLGMTFLNPHVYLDTVIFLGVIANQFGEQRWQFAIGAMCASVIWFFAIGYGSRAASRFMGKPAFWRILDSLIAAIMLALAVSLALVKIS